MSELNYINETVVPRMPKSVSDEQLFVFVPVGNDTVAGIFKINTRDFDVASLPVLTIKQDEVVTQNGAGFVRGRAVYSFVKTEVDSLNNIKQNKKLSEPIAGETTVEDALTNLAGRMNTAEGDINTLKTIVGDATSGLVKIVQTTGQSTSDVMSQKAVTDELNKKANSADLATVATSGSYNDLTDKPEVPGVTVDIVQTTGQSTSDVMSQKAVTDELNKKANSADLATVATSGSYNDLSNKPTNYVTTDTTQNNIAGRKTFTTTIVKKSNTIDLNDKPTSGTQWNYIEFTDKNDDRIGIAGSRFDAGGYAGIYLQARNSQQLWIASSTPDSNGNTVTKTSTPTPPATDDSTQIANTAWVRENYQATCYAGRDTGETGTRYFKVASYSTVADYDQVTLVAHLRDIDTAVFSTVNVRCSTSTKAYAPNAFIGVVDNFTYAASNSLFNYYKDRLFVVANYTIGTQGVTFELWLKTTDEYQQTIFNVISQSSRKGTSKKRPWTLYNNVTTASGTTDFSETSSDGRLVVNNNYLYGATVSYLQPQTDGNVTLGSASKRFGSGYFKANVNIYHDEGSIPNISMINSGLVNGTNPSATASVQVIGRDETGLALTGWRGWVSTTGYASSHLYARSFGTGYANFVAFYGKPNATDLTNSNIWYFAPSTSNNIDLGVSGQRWNNAYIKNIHADNIPFDSNGLSTGTLGATTKLAEGRYYIERDITIGYNTTHVAVVVDGTSNDVYVPIRISDAMNFISVCLILSGTNLVSVGMALHDSSGSIVDNKTVTAGTFKYKKLD